MCRVINKKIEVEIISPPSGQKLVVSDCGEKLLKSLSAGSSGVFERSVQFSLDACESFLG